MSAAEVALLERCALNAWPALASSTTMGWVLRSANGYTKRANSANALAPTGEIAALLGDVEAYYHARGQPPIVRLSPLAPPGADAALAEAGYALFQPSLVMTAPLDRAAHDPAVTLSTQVDDTWLDASGEATGEPRTTIPHHAAILRAITAPHAFASVLHEGRPVALGLAVTEARRTGLFDIAVASSHRGRGLARTLCAALLGWGVSTGAQAAYLQVTAQNVPALRTYAALGFAEAYRYHYRVGPQPSQLA